ncbi:ATP-binding protein [Streptomyces sp. NPDC021622]|uniref:ATP-binding protein n=1 Tax=Streptomyces sp. NPDC021622 TaxID=3155013 RepID=UPI0033C0965E
MSGHSERTPGKARSFVGDTLADWGVAEAVRADMRLIVSELATNAVTYTRSPEITLGVRLTDDEAVVSVGDRGPHRQLRPQDVAANAEHGRGLRIVAALASRWHQRETDGGGTTVEAAIDLPSHQITALPVLNSEAALDAPRHDPDLPARPTLTPARTPEQR